MRVKFVLDEVLVIGREEFRLVLFMVGVMICYVMLRVFLF